MIDISPEAVTRRVKHLRFCFGPENADAYLLEALSAARPQGNQNLIEQLEKQLDEAWQALVDLNGLEWREMWQAEPSPEMEPCSHCEASGLALNAIGEVGLCSECRGNTVVPVGSL